VFHVIDDLLDRYELAAVAEAAEALQFEDGKRTATGAAQKVKDNLQAAAGPAREAVLKKAEAALLSNAVFASVARPRAFARMLVSRYVEGHAYGVHVDDPIINGQRTDLSFTLFLSAPETYDGGALIVRDRVEERAFKLKAGSALVYPSDTLHRVQPVTSGQRLAIVGWVTSWVREPAHREILFDLDAAIAVERGRDDPEALARLVHVRANLMRMWAQ